jgi:choline-sulfatase/uncharacterized sulfatase
MNKPNVLFLFSDQHNARCLSCAGHPNVLTPNLDRLAREGTLFTNCYAQNPICTPSRISFLSGLYPSTHGYYGLYGRQPIEPLTNMFSYFRECGYRTGALGKLHTPRYWIERDCQFIYDEFIEFPKYLEGAGLYDRNDNRAFLGDRNGESSLLPLEHSCEMALAKQAIRFFKNEGEPADRGKESDPWFGWITFSRPHQPYTPSEPFASAYPPESLILPPISTLEKASVKNLREQYPESRLRKYISAYLGAVSQVDYAIGVVIKELERIGQVDNTIIVYSADHGDYAGEHGLIEKKGGISYRAITRSPLIIRVPRHLSPGTHYDEIIESIDLFPTLCDLTGLEIPNTVQGKSFSGIISGQEKWERKNALTENPYRKALSTKHWRYIANLEGEEDELYDLQKDPWELSNRIQDPDLQDLARDLLRTLLHRVVQARKPINTINGFWHQHAYDRDQRIDLNSCGPQNPYW